MRLRVTRISEARSYERLGLHKETFRFPSHGRPLQPVIQVIRSCLTLPILARNTCRRAGTIVELYIAMLKQRMHALGPWRVGLSGDTENTGLCR